MERASHTDNITKDNTNIHYILEIHINLVEISRQKSVMKKSGTLQKVNLFIFFSKLNTRFENVNLNDNRE